MQTNSLPAPMPRALAHARRHLLGLAATLGLVLVLPAEAATFDVREIVLENGPDFSQRVTGTLETRPGTADLVNWHLTVTSRELLGHFTPANTVNRSSGPLRVDAGASGAQLQVGASANGFDDGGSLSFGAARPGVEFAVAPADFTGDNIAGGVAFYLARGNFDLLPFGDADGSFHTVAASAPGSTSTFELAPISFAGGAVMRGTVRTRGNTGAIGAADFTDWDIYVEQFTQDVFDATNSRAFARGLALTPDGSALTVANPDGLLMFSKGSIGGHPFALQLADFTDPSPRGGQAGYYQGALSVTNLPLGAPPRSEWRVTGGDPIVGNVPEPASVALFAVGFAGLLLRRLRGFSPA